MAVSLEARAPLLDSRVAEFAWSLPLGFKRSETTSKVLLKRVLGRYVPQSMVHRPKRGFGAPVSDWLKGDLRPWAEDLLQAARLEREGVLSAPYSRCGSSSSAASASGIPICGTC